MMTIGFVAGIGATSSLVLPFSFPLSRILKFQYPSDCDIRRFFFPRSVIFVHFNQVSKYTSIEKQFSDTAILR